MLTESSIRYMVFSELVVLLLRLEPSNTQSNTCICFAKEHTCIEEMLYHKEKARYPKRLSRAKQLRIRGSTRKMQGMPMGEERHDP